MENETEIIDSPNDEYVEPEAQADGDVVPKEKYQKLVDTNRQLFQRAKKAEGFELKDGHWTKAQKPEPRAIQKEPEVKPKSDDLDYGELAYYNTRPDGIKVVHDDDLEFLRSTMKETGKSLKDVMSSRFFQSELKERQDSRLALNGTPSGTRRTGDTGNLEDVAYSKYEQTKVLPDDPALRRKLVNKRQEKERMANQFTSQSVVG